ncbi:uncharacterized protein LOC115967927 [Quercus lobata]|uniref:uncharacterized protein LOC115967927 n=1 Tax=Quercus lobata TaxID=97700 RepID=UPI0012481B62|nr:uncharacterized protein LOC115967927 [Quercus lobata]
MMDQLSHSEERHQEQLAKLDARHKEQLIEADAQHKEQLAKALAQSDAKHKEQMAEMMLHMRDMLAQLSPLLHSSLPSQCQNGHTLCSTYKTRVQNLCPTCRQELGDGKAPQEASGIAIGRLGTIMCIPNVCS